MPPFLWQVQRTNSNEKERSRKIPRQNRQFSAGIPDFLALALFALSALTGSAALAAPPIQLHPRNPHYFLFRGRPTILVGSTEHYGAVLNLDFDYVTYLNTLYADGLNLTRTFAGSYREVPGSFNIEQNTLAPLPSRFLCPWARSSVPGALDGGNKFDLTRWDRAYFDRLRDFISQAGDRGIVVELVLFCTIYNDDLWRMCPLNVANNINGVGRLGREEVHTMKDPATVAAQDAMVRKIIAEVRDFDNLYYEVINEPYFAGVSDEWQNHIIGTIREAESGFATRHMIAQNVANGRRLLYEPNGALSVLNFHYAAPPVAVVENYHLNRAIAFDETGFAGSADSTYRVQAWEFVLAGGAVFNHLDYSFTVKNPDGTAQQKAPGGGSPALRKQLRILKDFMNSVIFLKMVPAPGVIRGGVSAGANLLYTWRDESPRNASIQQQPAGPRAWALVDEGEAYAIYINGGRGVILALELPAGSYRAEWVNTKTGAIDKRQNFKHAGGERRLQSPPYAEDIALRIVRRRARGAD